MKSIPQGLKAIQFARLDVRAKARTYPRATFSAACTRRSIRNKNKGQALYKQRLPLSLTGA
jgi:hypothetical protein